METSYTLEVRHTGDEVGDFCVYQTNDKHPEEIRSLVWLKKRAHPETVLRFKWNEEYDFTWSDTGNLAPGAIFNARDTVPANPGDIGNNTISFTRQQSGFVLQKTDEQTTRGRIGIACNENIPAKTASIGIAMSGNSAFACTASPNMKYTFRPHPRYWIAFGKFEEGEVIDLNRMDTKCEIVFKANQNKKTIRFTEGNKWIDESK